MLLPNMEFGICFWENRRRFSSGFPTRLKMPTFMSISSGRIATRSYARYMSLFRQLLTECLETAQGLFVLVGKPFDFYPVSSATPAEIKPSLSGSMQIYSASR